jgi:restriction system protein
MVKSVKLRKSLAKRLELAEAQVESLGEWFTNKNTGIKIFLSHSDEDHRRFFYHHDILHFLLRDSWVQRPALTLTGLVLPERKTSEGTLVRATSLVWAEIIAHLGKDWSKAFEIPPDKWEEIIAGAFVKDGYDKVILTPRSGDGGRDVIAIKEGVGGVKILGSMKAYKPGHLVSHEHVREMLGVLAAEPDASKAIISTTSDFAPKIKSNERIKKFMPTRLELMNGEDLQKWLVKLAKK